MVQNPVWKQKKNGRIHATGHDRAFVIIVYALLTLITLLILYPLIFVLSASISDPNAVNSGKVWLWPVGLQWKGYAKVFESRWVLVGYRNSLIYLVFGTALNVFVTFTGAYALSRKDFVGRGLLLKIFAFTMFFSGGLIPSYCPFDSHENSPARSPRRAVWLLKNSFL